MSLIRSAGAGAFLILGPLLILTSIGAQGAASVGLLIGGALLLLAAIIHIVGISVGRDPDEPDRAPR